MTTQADLYDVLEVSRDATQEEIKRAFRKKAMEFHPDRNKAEDAETRFKEVSAAYEVLSDPEKRSAYDRFGMAGVGGGAQGFAGQDFGGFGDIFDAFFRGTGVRRSGPQRGHDLRAVLTLAFEDAVFGTDHELEFERVEACTDCRGRGQADGKPLETCPECQGSGELRRVQQSLFGQFVNVATCSRCSGEGSVVTDPCPECRGRGTKRVSAKKTVKIPAGIDDGQTLRISGEGDAGHRGGPAGNLYVEVQVDPHERFIREDDNLVLELPVNIAQAALGTEVPIETLEGEPREVRVEPGTQSGRIITLKGLGVPHLRGGGRGDLLVQVNVVTPTKLDEAQRELLEQLAASLGTPGGHEAGLFERLRDAFHG
ncbi:MAG: molecular chaperone DnaJ [Dehalococcoidia bacterium]